MTDNLYLKITHHDDTYFIMTNKMETGAEVKRKLAPLTGKKVNEMRLVVPRLRNQPFENVHSVRQILIENGEQIIMLFRDKDTGAFEKPKLFDSSLFSSD